MCTFNQLHKCVLLINYIILAVTSSKHAMANISYKHTPHHTHTPNPLHINTQTQI